MAGDLVTRSETESWENGGRIVSDWASAVNEVRGYGSGAKPCLEFTLFSPHFVCNYSCGMLSPYFSAASREANATFSSNTHVNHPSITIETTANTSTSELIEFKRRQRAAAWLVHLLTTAGAVLGLFALNAIHDRQFILAFWFMGGALLIDGWDGTLSRRFRTRLATPGIDGATLDNIIDYLNYVIVPAFFLIASDLLPENWRMPVTALIVLASAYQFSQTDAKTKDHFFKGFPSYWNIVVFFLFIWELSPLVNALILVFLVALVFVPIKYVYPSRTNYLTRSRTLRLAFTALTVAWGLALGALLWIYPQSNRGIVFFTIAFMAFYILVSLYRTLVPLERRLR